VVRRTPWEDRMTGNDRDNVQAELLRGIWGELKILNQRVDRKIDRLNFDLGTRIDQVRTDLGDRIDQVRTDLGARIDQTNARLDVVEVVLRDFSEQQLKLVRFMAEGAHQQDRTNVAYDEAIAGHDEAISDLRERVAQLESKQPTPKTP
jgi:hypothetical protein